MSMATMKVRLTGEQVLELARQLSDEEKLKFDSAFRAEIRGIEFKRLLEAFGNVDVDITQEEIDAECEAVRQEMYERRRKN